MSVYGIVSNAALFMIGYAAMRYIGGRRWKALPTVERDGLTASMRV